MTDKKDSTQQALDDLSNAIQQFKKAKGTTAERLELAEGLIADIFASLGKLGGSVSDMSKAYIIMLKGMQVLGDRVTMLEKHMQSVLIFPKANNTPGDFN